MPCDVMHAVHLHSNSLVCNNAHPTTKCVRCVELQSVLHPLLLLITMQSARLSRGARPLRPADGRARRVAVQPKAFFSTLQNFFHTAKQQAPTKKQPNPVAVELLELVSTTNRGLDTSADQKSAIMDLVEQLEQQHADVDTNSPELLTATWKLAWTTEKVSMRLAAWGIMLSYLHACMQEHTHSSLHMTLHIDAWRRLSHGGCRHSVSVTHCLYGKSMM